MPRRETHDQETATQNLKKYRVLRADFPIVVQGKILTTGGEVELEETEQVQILLEEKIIQEV